MGIRSAYHSMYQKSAVNEDVAEDIHALSDAEFALKHGHSKEQARRALGDDEAHERFNRKVKRQFCEDADDFEVLEDERIDEATKIQPVKPARQWNVGDIVHPKVGPHKGEPHKVIHVHADGRMNIVPQVNIAAKNKYRLGAACCTDDQLDVQVPEKKQKALDKRNTPKEEKPSKEHVAVRDTEGKFAGRFKTMAHAKKKHAGGGVTFHPIKLNEDSYNLLDRYLPCGSIEESWDNAAKGGVIKRHPTDKKAYVHMTHGDDDQPRYKASDRHGHLKFYNELGRKSALKHAGLNEDVQIDEARQPSLKSRLEDNVLSDHMSKSKDGVHTFRRGFFYRSGGTSEKWADQIHKQLESAGIKHTMVGHEEVNTYKPFRGGASVKSQPHWAAHVRIHENVNEDVLNELSKTTLRNYFGKAANERGSAEKIGDTKRFKKRDQGSETALNKLFKEMTTDLLARHAAAVIRPKVLSEVSKEMAGRYIKKARADYIDRSARKEMLDHAQGLKPADVAGSEERENKIRAARNTEGRKLNNRAWGMHRANKVVAEEHGGNFYVVHGDKKVTGPHPSTEQAEIALENYAVGQMLDKSELSIKREELNESQDHEHHEPDAYGRTGHKSQCWACGGHGTEYEETCVTCGGNGWVRDEHPIHEISTHSARVYMKSAFDDIRRNRSREKKKKHEKRDKMITLAANKVTKGAAKVHTTEENNLLGKYFVSENFSKMSHKALKTWLDHNDSDEPGMSPVYGQQIKTARKEYLRRKAAGLIKEEEQITEARRGRPPKNAIAGREEDERENIIVQLRKNISMAGSKKIKFRDGSQHDVAPRHSELTLSKYASLQPRHKEQFQAHIEASHANLMNHSDWKPTEEKNEISTRPLEGKDARTIKKPLHRRPVDPEHEKQKRLDFIRSIVAKQRRAKA